MNTVSELPACKVLHAGVELGFFNPAVSVAVHETHQLKALLRVEAGWDVKLQEKFVEGAHCLAGLDRP